MLDRHLGRKGADICGGLQIAHASRKSLAVQPTREGMYGALAGRFNVKFGLKVRKETRFMCYNATTKRSLLAHSKSRGM